MVVRVEVDPREGPDRVEGEDEADGRRVRALGVGVGRRPLPANPVVACEKKRLNIFDFIVFIVRIIWESVVVQVQVRRRAR